MRYCLLALLLLAAPLSAQEPQPTVITQQPLVVNLGDNIINLDSLKLSVLLECDSACMERREEGRVLTRALADYFANCGCSEEREEQSSRTMDVISTISMAGVIAALLAVAWQIHNLDFSTTHPIEVNVPVKEPRQHPTHPTRDDDSSEGGMKR